MGVYPRYLCPPSALFTLVAVLRIHRSNASYFDGGVLPRLTHIHLVLRGRCVDDDMPTPSHSQGREPACTTDKRDWWITDWTTFWEDSGLPAQLAH